MITTIIVDRLRRLWRRLTCRPNWEAAAQYVQDIPTESGARWGCGCLDCRACY